LVNKFPLLQFPYQTVIILEVVLFNLERERLRMYVYVHQSKNNSAKVLSFKNT